MAAKTGQALNPLGGQGRKPAPPREPFDVMTRMRAGAFSIEEVAQLAGCSDKKVRNDEAIGEIVFIRRGGRTLIPGPIAARYLGLHLQASEDRQPSEPSETDESSNGN